MLLKTGPSTKSPTTPADADAELRAQFEYERDAAIRLLNAPAGARRGLYREFTTVLSPLRREPAYGGRRCSQRYRSQFGFIWCFVRAGRDDFVQLGSGSGKLCVEMARFAKTCIGIDATGWTLPNAPTNCRFMIDDLVDFSLPDNSVDVAFSSQVLEHLHPDDCKVVIGKIFRALRPGWFFVNIVPNWLTGPHDVSVHFSQKAEGLHLREYDNGELSGLMRAAGFTHCTSYIGAKGFFISLPSALVAIVEKGLRAMPRALRRQAAVRAFVGIRMTARKPS